MVCFKSYQFELLAFRVSSKWATANYQNNEERLRVCTYLRLPTLVIKYLQTYSVCITYLQGDQGMPHGWTGKMFTY